MALQEQVPSAILGGLLLVGCGLWLRVNLSTETTRSRQIKGYERRIYTLQEQRDLLEIRLEEARTAQLEAEMGQVTAHAHSEGLKIALDYSASSVIQLTKDKAALENQIVELQAEVRRLQE